MKRSMCNRIASLLTRNSFHSPSTLPRYTSHRFQTQMLKIPSLYDISCASPRNSAFSAKPASKFVALRHLKTTSTLDSVTEQNREDSNGYDANGEVEPIDIWEEEDEAEPEIGDGGDGGGVVLQNCPWGEKALAIAQEVLLNFGEDMEIYAFKTSHQGYIYVRLDRLSNECGCPSMDDLESFSRQYKQRLDEVGSTGEIPNDLALEVSSPGADRLLRVPNDLVRFKEMPMMVSYKEDSDMRSPEKTAVFFLDSVETESECCIWKLADVKENRDPAAKGRPMNRKQRDWRLRLPYDMIGKVTLYLN